MIIEDDRGTFVPVGGTVRVNGKEYVCVRDFNFSCKDCDLRDHFRPGKCGIGHELPCTVFCREDNENVIFKEVENATEE